MTTIVIPDLHLKIDVAQRILAEHPERPLRAIYLGDYHDDFDDTPEMNGSVARWLARRIENPEPDVFEEFLIGNHDFQYLYEHLLAKMDYCGYTVDKSFAINSWLKPHVRRFRFYTTVGSWLLTHAGFSAGLIQPITNPVSSEILQTVIDMAVRDLERHVVPALFLAGQDRGGAQRHGGILWCDFKSFEPVPGVNQLMGHTPGHVPRVKRGTGPVASINFCLDTHAHHYAVYEPGTDSWEFREIV